jgi:hypothetical protein
MIVHGERQGVLTMRNLLWAAPALLLGMQLCASADTIPPGTQIVVRTDQPFELHTWDRGRIYPARVAEDVRARDGDIVIHRGANVEMIVRQTGPDQMALDVESVTVNGTRYAMDTTGPQYNMSRQDYDRGAGMIGNIVGAITGGQVRGNEINVPAGAMITFQLQQPLHVVNYRDPGYERDRYHYHRDPDWYR